MKEVLLLLVMFWNVENFFDPFNDPVAADEEFTPGGTRFWTWRKFEKKRDDIAKVILLVKERYGVFPAVIGLCEVENRFVLRNLLEQTPLARAGYRIIHKDSPDKRGIDVAMLYDPQLFKLAQVKFFPLAAEEGGGAGSVPASRLILYAKGVVGGLDTLHCFVNHWPSRLGGEAHSLPRRMLASNTLRAKTDSILLRNSGANIILMGDFNDTPGAVPVKNIRGFVNMADRFKDEGTYKYKGKWEILDQFLVSERLAPGKEERKSPGDSPAAKESGFMNEVRWVYCKRESMEIFRDNYLLERDEVYMGEKLRRTLSGPRYLGGVSDHLPVLLQLFGIVF